MGPFPDMDVLGYSVAVNMLLKTLKQGKYGNYTQFDTVRKLWSAFANMYIASVEGALSDVFVGRDIHTALITRCPTQSETRSSQRWVKNRCCDSFSISILFYFFRVLHRESSRYIAYLVLYSNIHGTLGNNL